MNWKYRERAFAGYRLLRVEGPAMLSPCFVWLRPDGEQVQGSDLSVIGASVWAMLDDLRAPVSEEKEWIK